MQLGFYDVGATPFFALQADQRVSYCLYVPESLKDEKNRSALETMNPDLKKFRDRGGKLILYHGWGDDAISPLNTRCSI